MSLTRVSHRRKGQTHLFAFYPNSAAPLISRRHQPCTPRSSPLNRFLYVHIPITQFASGLSYFVGPNSNYRKSFLISSMAARASRKLLRDFVFRRSCTTPIGAARHCSSAAETAPKIPKIPHFSKRVCFLSLSSLYICKGCIFLIANNHRKKRVMGIRMSLVSSCMQTNFTKVVPFHCF